MRLTAAPPYSQLAAHYDRFVGRAQFRHAQRIFEYSVRKQGLRFSSVADFGCGSGLLARHVASRWRVPVYAIDRSPQMLGIAVRRCRRLPCTFLLRDYRTLVLPQPVDLITMFSFTLNLELSVAALSEVLESVWRNLLPGGSWIVDFLTPRQSVTLPPDSGCAQARILFRGPRRFCLGIGIHSQRRARRYEERHCARLLAPVELRDQLDRCGFVLVDALDHATLGLVQHASPALVFVVRKPRCAQTARYEMLNR
jgi:ubiquinone/menaquinone biosynthesis C-methylase UbiE